jgi:hypothetical protein
VKSQLVPSQVVVLAPVGFGHDVHEVPHESTTLFDLHRPWQSCVPDAQTPEQAVALPMQAPAQSFIPVGHAGTHEVPSHVTVPPVGCWQLVHEVVPQLPMSLLLTHLPPQRWYPVWQARLQTPPAHWAAPLGSVGHAVHEGPQPVGSLSVAHLPAHWCVPVVH